MFRTYLFCLSGIFLLVDYYGTLGIRSLKICNGKWARKIRALFSFTLNTNQALLFNKSRWWHYIWKLFDRKNAPRTTNSTSNSSSSSPKTAGHWNITIFKCLAIFAIRNRSRTKWSPGSQIWHLLQSLVSKNIANTKKSDRKIDKKIKSSKLCNFCFFCSA